MLALTYLPTKTQCIKVLIFKPENFFEICFLLFLLILDNLLKKKLEDYNDFFQ